jgi:hypothetical protein
MQRTPVQITRTGRIVLAMVVAMAMGNLANAATVGGSTPRGEWTRCLCEAARQLAGVQVAISTSTAPAPTQLRAHSTLNPVEGVYVPTTGELPTLIDLPPPTHF